MFGTQDSMRMEPTPERVLSLARTVARGPITHDELRDILSLGAMEDLQVSIINSTIKVALEELSLLNTKNDKLEVAVSKEILESTTSFRRYVASKVFANKESTFVQFTRWLVSQNDQLFKMSRWEVMGKNAKVEVPSLAKMNENAVLGWRFWATFLGIGYISGTMFLPNMKLRLQDLFSTEFAKTFKYGETVRADAFSTWLSVKLPEADLNGKWPLAVSAGLRTLHELKLIKLESWRDSTRVQLFNLDGDPVNDFSHITVYEEVQ